LYGVLEGAVGTARLLTSARRCDHITPLLRQLHWLPVQRRVEFKIACQVTEQLTLPLGIRPRRRPQNTYLTFDHVFFHTSFCRCYVEYLQQVTHDVIHPMNFDFQSSFRTG